VENTLLSPSAFHVDVLDNWVTSVNKGGTLQGQLTREAHFKVSEGIIQCNPSPRLFSVGVNYCHDAPLKPRIQNFW
jgi:hypothetical protein